MWLDRLRIYLKMGRHYFYDLTAKWDIDDRIKSIYPVILVEIFLSLMNDKVLIGAIKLEQSDGTIFLVKNYFKILLVIFSDYDYGFSFGDDDADTFDWSSNIKTYDLKPDSIILNAKNEIVLERSLFWNLNRRMRLESVMVSVQISFR